MVTQFQPQPNHFSDQRRLGRPVACRAGSLAAGANENAHPEVSISYNPGIKQGDVHGRIRFDGIATVITCVIGY